MEEGAKNIDGVLEVGIRWEFDESKLCRHRILRHLFHCQLLT